MSVSSRGKSVDPVTQALREELQERTAEIASGVEREFNLIGQTPTTEESDEAIRALALADPKSHILEEQIVEREQRELADDASSAESWDDLVKTPPSVQRYSQHGEHSEIDRRAQENEKRAREIIKEARDVPASFTPPGSGMSAILFKRDNCNYKLAGAYNRETYTDLLRER